MTTTVRPQGRAERQARARQQASERNERLGALLREAQQAMHETLEAWRRGAPAFALARHVEDVIARLRRVRARVLLDAEPADSSGRGAAQQWAERA